jgi:hypothetical protein
VPRLAWPGEKDKAASGETAVHRIPATDDAIRFSID